MCTDMHAHMHLHTLDHQIDWVNQTIATVCARMLTMKQWLRVSFILSLLKTKINRKKSLFSSRKIKYACWTFRIHCKFFGVVGFTLKRKITCSCCRYIGLVVFVVGCVYCYYFVFVFVLLLLAIDQGTSERTEEKIYVDYFPFERLKYTHIHKLKHIHTYLKWKANRRTIFQSSLKSVDRSWCRLFSLLNLLCWSIFKFSFSILDKFFSIRVKTIFTIFLYQVWVCSLMNIFEHCFEGFFQRINKQTNGHKVIKFFQRVFLCYSSKYSKIYL